LLALKQGFGAPPKIDAAIASTSPPVRSDGMADLAAAMVRAAQSPEPELIRAEIGKMALDAQTISEEASVSRLMFAPFVGQAWPSLGHITAVDEAESVRRAWNSH
jgi:hypothetical protein